MNPKTIRSLKTLSTAMVLVAVVFVFLIAGVRIFGIQVFGVLTGSMEPSYPTGSLIYVKDVEPSKLRVNDVITFSISPNVIATHRIVEIVPDENNPSVVRYRTKGDANNDVDASLVNANNIIGKALFAIPQMGYLASYIQQPPGLYVAILVCGLMIAFVFYTDSLENKQKQGNAAQQRPQAAAKRVDVTKIINQLSVKLLGKSMLKPKNVTPTDASSFRQGYVPQQPVQQYGYPQQMQQPYSGMQNQFPQQSYGQQGHAQPVTYAQQPSAQAYYQQPAPQQYYNPYQQPVQQAMPPQPYTQQGYGQQVYQPPYPQQTPYPPRPQQTYPQQGYQQSYAAPNNQVNGYAQKNSTVQQRRTRRTDRM
ncbi:MAG: signal peptidase I [Clostridia bacterium]|nr:signal peptidase I [Clostridia bacterium]